MTTTVYHNPRCSKSRETVNLLENRQINFQTKLYLVAPPHKDEIKMLLNALGLKGARDLMRTKEDIYKQLKLAETDCEKTLIEAMHNHPQLIERPIVIVGDVAKIGRPPESVLTLFD